MLDQIFRSEMTGNIITVLFALATFRVLFQAKSAVKSGNRSKDVEIASTMMTSLGILGTFVGIVIGLMVFDPAHVDKSIKGLLGGLRTAFLTSVVGMGCTMYFKWWDAKQTPSVTANDQNTDSIGPKDIYAILRKHQELTSLLVQAVGGGEENSLVGQMKLLRTEVVDFRAPRKTSFSKNHASINQGVTKRSR